MSGFSKIGPGLWKTFSTIKSSRRICQINKRFVVTGNANFDRVLVTATGGKAEGWMRAYEKLVGLTDVREAQDKVIQAENDFANAQSERRHYQSQLLSVQNNLRTVTAELEKVQRGQERYLTLITEEHTILKEENNIQDQIALAEDEERNKFALLSSAVRESHEKERARTERTKYWSIIGSIIGAIIGILGTSINNYLRMREIRNIVTDSAEGGHQLSGLVSQLSSTMQGQHNTMSEFITDLKELMGSLGAGSGISPVHGTKPASLNMDQLMAQSEAILERIKQQDKAVEHEMQDIKALLAAGRITDDDGQIVYVGPAVENMLGETERNLEWKIKANALWTVTFIYGAFALTLPVLYHIFKGS